MKNIEEWFTQHLSFEKERQLNEQQKHGYSMIRPANQLLDLCESYQTDLEISRQLTLAIGQETCVIRQQTKGEKEAYCCITYLDDVFLETQLLIENQNVWYLRRFTMDANRKPTLTLPQHENLYLQVEHHLLTRLSQKETYRLYAITGSLDIYNQLKNRE